jgi:phage portal protein BeeE
VLEYARDSIGLGQTLESYASKIFSRGGLRAGVIEVPGTLSEEASKRMAKSFVTATGNWHLPKVLEQGSTFKAGHARPREGADDPEPAVHGQRHRALARACRRT